jgi:hypothetical protein
MTRWMAILGLLSFPALSAGEEAGPAVDHSAYDALLRKHVDGDGMVDYKRWKAEDEKALRDYVAALGGTDPAKLGRDERLAFWINAYNALTIQGILEFYPLKSIKDKVSYFFGFNIWEDYPMVVSGKKYSLGDIEHKILRKMDEPRIHFAIVCASKGCPRLLNEAYTGERLDAQLEGNARDFFARLRNFRIDRRARTIWLSSIFDWFSEDFGGSARSKLDWAKKHVAAKDDRAYLDAAGLRIKYLDYDWKLNEQERRD